MNEDRVAPLVGTVNIVNCVTPSATDTSLYRSEPEHDRLRQVNKIPLNRIAQPIETAITVLIDQSNSLKFTKPLLKLSQLI